jgi:probable HAF family extracellular repeat protein
MRLAQLGAPVFGVTLALVALRTPSHAVLEYEISAIAPPPGYVEFYPSAINDAGQVVGTASDAETGLKRAVVWRNGTSIELGSLGGTCSRGSAIKDVGQVVGDSCTGATADELHAFVWDGVFMVDLGLTGRESRAEGVNAAGLVVGYERDSLGNAHAMLWERGEGHHLDRFESGFSGATQINDRGEIVFWAMVSGAGGSAESYLSENGSLSYVGAFESTGLNAAGR